MTEGEAIQDNPKISESATGEIPQPIGERVIGLVDPRTLTQEEFEQSGEALFHGAGEHFKFSRSHDYSEEQFSHTLGEGLYLTDDRKEAVSYATRRQKDKRAPPIMYTFLPYQARMFDFRSSGSLRINAPVPKDFLQQWMNYYQTIIDQEFPEGYDVMKEIEFINSKDSQSDLEERGKRAHRVSTYGQRTAYIRHLKRTATRPQGVDIRTMLGRDGDTTEWNFTKGDFTRFMRSIGYDGVIAYEGGDSKEQWKKNPASYVFYNLDKVGTYESWHQEEKQAV